MVPGAMNSVNKILLLFFCVKKTNHSTYLTAGGSGDDSVHVSSLILHYAEKMYEGRHSAITNFTCYY
jgi:hypothetical protein